LKESSLLEGEDDRIPYLLPPLLRLLLVDWEGEEALEDRFEDEFLFFLVLFCFGEATGLLPLLNDFDDDDWFCWCCCWCFLEEGEDGDRCLLDLDFFLGVVIFLLFEELEEGLGDGRRSNI